MIRIVWCEVITNELMNIYTWSGTPKPDINEKERGLAVKGFRLLSAVTEVV
jgi:hypothetical protein